MIIPFSFNFKLELLYVLNVSFFANYFRFVFSSQQENAPSSCSGRRRQQKPQQQQQQETERVLFISPFERYQMIRPYLESLIKKNAPAAAATPLKEPKQEEEESPVKQAVEHIALVSTVVSLVLCV